MPRIILVLVFTFLCNLTAGAGEIDKAGKRKPNILLIFVDDLGYGELGCQGNKQIATPHIDTISTNGIRFTDVTERAGLLEPHSRTDLTGIAVPTD